MKILKKISLAYTLQAFAVLILFGDAVSSSAAKTKENTGDGIAPFKIKTQLFFNSTNDTLKSKKENDLFNAYIDKHW